MSNTNRRANNNFSLAEKRQLLAGLLHQKTASLKTYPTSFAQQRLWFLHQLEPDSPAYHLPCVIQLTGALSISALTQALDEIVRRHEVLRTTFVMSKGQPIQVAVPKVTLTIPQIDLHQIPASKRDREVLRLANEEARRSFDLVKAPLLRVTLLSFAESNHVVLFTMHHIVSDAWSMQLLVQELTTLYTAFSSGKQSPLTELPIQYADFAVWQRQQLQGGILETQLEYWLNQLSGELPNLHLPTDRPRPIAQSSRGAIYSFVLSDELTQQLESLSQRENATLFMTLLAAFNTLLYRYTGQSDILIGSPIANRNRPEIERLIGFFVNTLVFRTHIAANQTFQALLHQVCEVALGAYANQDLPFELLVEKLQPQRTLSHKPLFQVMFVLQNAPERSMVLPGVTLHSQFSHTDTAKFDLTLSMSKREGGLTGQIEYSTDLFEPATIARMVSHLQNLLYSIVCNPQQRLSELPLLTEPEQRQVLTEWNDTRTDYSPDRCIHQLVEAQVECTPDAIALVFEDQQLSYQELNHRANQLAHYLRSLGVKPEQLVGLCLERSLDMVIAILAVLKAGAAYVPFDPSYPSERLSFMLHDAQVPVLLTQQRLIPTLPEHSAQLIYLDNIWDVIATFSQTNPAQSIAPDHLSYVIYTSGSTGRPKGVMNTHQGVCNRLHWMQDAYHLTSADRILQKTPYSFDVSVWEFFWSLMVGATLVIARPGGHQDSQYLVQLMVQERITTLHFVPSMLQVFLDEPSLAHCHHYLKRILCSGEALPLPLQQRCVEQLEAELHNLYGPTEAAIDVTAWHCQSQENQTSVPIGHPIANTQIYLLDAHGQPVPIGVPGELHIGGVQLARGYWQRAELTAERFVPHPFGPEPGARLYKTGDLARYLPDGAIEYLGRLDHQVKIRGFRIELGEIEAALHQHPGVQQAVVIARESELGSQQLTAYVVSQPAQVLSISDLRRFLEQQLPPYMVPAVFVFLDALPLSPNGKLDRRALPIPDAIRPELEQPFQPPRNAAEAKLAEIWAKILRLEQVGIDDNFFELGGDSILSLQVIAKANQAGLHLTPRQLFQYQTIAELAAAASATSSPQAEQGLVTGSVPLTPIQHWFFEQNLPDAHYYNQAVLLEVHESLDLATLEQIVYQLLLHHDVLRSRFTQTEVGWQQEIVASNWGMPCIGVDLSHLALAQQRAAIATAATKLQSSLNLAQGDLLRVALFSMGTEQPARLLIVIHHLVIDGVSWRILLEGFQTAYRQLVQAKPIQFPAKTTSFKQWSQSLLEYAQSPAVQHDLEYWTAEPYKQGLRLPVDFPNGTNTEASAATLSTHLSEAETQALLQKVPVVYHTHVNEILLTALAQAFAEWTEKTQFRIDLEGHGREDLWDGIDISRTVGWFTSIYPVVLEIQSSFHPGDALKAIKEQIRRIPKRGMSYGLLCHLASASHGEQLRSLPPSDVLFNYLGQFDQLFTDSTLFRVAQESSGLSRSSKGHRSHLLSINGMVVGGKLQLQWTYSEALHRRTTIETVAQSCLEGLRSLITHCQSPEAGGFTPSDFPLLRQLDQSQLDRALNRVKF